MLRQRSTGHHDQVAISLPWCRTGPKMYVDFNGYRNCLRLIVTIGYACQHYTSAIIHNALPNCAVCIFTNHISTLIFNTDVSYDTHIFNLHSIKEMRTPNVQTIFLIYYALRTSNQAYIAMQEAVVVVVCMLSS
jgi:hypothetical protein